MSDKHPNSVDRKSPPSLSVDWEKYGELLDASDLTDEQKREIIETLWALVLSFVDLGFGVSSPEKTCGHHQDDGPALLREVVSSALEDSVSELESREEERSKP